MTIEVILFGLVGLVCIAAAGLMLWSKNAVHSALFLIVNFIGVAVLYLMLEAPFLAMVQIAVYAGAIMVLFLFVIMLLGAERTGAGGPTRRFRWMPPAVLVLTVFFGLLVGLTLLQGQVDTSAGPQADAQIRFVHAAPVAAAVAPQRPAEESEETEDDEATETTSEAAESTVETIEESPAAQVATRPAITPFPDDRVFTLLIDGEVVDEAFTFGENTDFAALAPGEHRISLSTPDTGQEVQASDFVVEASSASTLVLAGEHGLAWIHVPQSDTPGMTLVNAYSPQASLSVGNLQNELFDDSRVLLPVVDDLAYGAYTTTPLQYPAGFPNWVAYIGGLTPAQIDSRLDTLSSFRRIEVARLTDLVRPEPNENALLVIAPVRSPDGTLRATATRLPPVVATPFGSANQVGERLFTQYLLPFQLVAMLLLAAMVGAIVITYRGEHVPKPSRTTRRKVSRPLTSVIASQTGADLTSGAPQLPERTETPVGD